MHMFGPLQDPQRSYSGTKILHLTLEENLHKLHLMNCLTIIDIIRAFQNFYFDPSRPLCLYHGAATLDKAAIWIIICLRGMAGRDTSGSGRPSSHQHC